MTRSLEALEELVRQRICTICSDRNIDGTCGLEDPESCALFRLFPQVALAIWSTDSDDIRDYVESLRRNVCAVCAEQQADGSCDVRAQVRCSLDAYLIPIVDAIEEATGKRFNRETLAQQNPSPIISLASGPLL